MPGPANIHSIAAIESFRGTLAQFELRVQNALESLSAEMRRLTDWLEHDRPRHWKEQTRNASDEVHQAKINLGRCLTFKVGDERPSCREEKAALRTAKLHVEYCHDKAERVKYWNRQLQHELCEYEGRVGHLKRLLENELPAARAKLKQIVRQIDAYQIERPPEISEPITAPLVNEEENES